MNHQVERERFIVAMRAEGMPELIAKKILRHAQTIQRCAELACSSEAADRDRVPCPAGTWDRSANHRASDSRVCWCHDDSAIPVSCSHCGCRPAGPCLCDAERGQKHETVPRIAVTSARAERLIREWAKKANGMLLESDVRQYGPDAPLRVFVPIFQGDPRGATVKIRVPSGKTGDWGQTGICVPAQGLPARAFR